jgi:hypothetical protein
VNGIKIISKKKPVVCEICLPAKQYKEYNKFFTENIKELKGLIVLNLNNAFFMISFIVKEARYMLIFTDYEIKVTWIRLLKNKEEASAEFIKFFI